MAVVDFSGAFGNINKAINNFGEGLAGADQSRQRSGIGEALLAGKYPEAASMAVKSGDLGSALKIVEMGNRRGDIAKFNEMGQGVIGGVPFGQPRQPTGINAVGAPQPAQPSRPAWSNYNTSGNLPSFARTGGSPDALRAGIIETARAIGADPVDLATAISFETAGTFDPTKSGPTTKWGRHRGLIQFGEPQAREYGVDWNNPMGSQLGANGAVAKYLTARGFRPGMSGLDLYSTINAGAPGRYAASDTAAGGTPGDVRDKWTNQMAGHRANAEKLLGDMGQQATQVASASPQAVQMAQAGIQRVDMLLNDPQTSPQERERLTGLRQQYAAVGQGGQQPQQAQAQEQADLPAQGSMEAQQSFAIPGTGETVPAGTRITPKAMNIMRMLQMDVPDGYKEPYRILLKQELEAANPATQLDIEGKRLSNEKARRELDGTGRIERGLTPQFGVDASGNPVMLQIGKDGTAVQTRMPDGVSLSKEPLRIDAGTHTVLLDPVTRQQIGLIPKNIGAAEAEKVTGKAQGEAMTNLPKAIGQAQGMLDTIRKVREHPGRESWGATGASSTWPIIGQGIPNTQGRNFVGLVNQLQGKAFLEAFESLKGGGQITEIEGKKATDAIARLDRAQTRDGFDAALKDLEDVVQTGINRAMAQARGGGAAPQQTGQGAPTSNGWNDIGGGYRIRPK